MFKGTHFSIGHYYISLISFEKVDSYRGEDSGAIYSIFGNYQVVKEYNLSAVINHKMPNSNESFKEYMDHAIQSIPRDAGEHYCPLGYSFMEIAQQIKGVISFSNPKYGIIGMQPEIFDYICYLGNGYYAIRKLLKYAITNAECELVDEDFVYDSVESPILDFVVVQKNGVKGIFSTSQKSFVVSMIYDTIEITKDIPYIIVGKDGKKGVVDIKGDIKIAIEYDSIEFIDNDFYFPWDFSNNRNTFFVINGDKKGVYHLDKGVVFPIMYNDIAGYCKDRIKVYDKERGWGIVDICNQIIIPISFKNIMLKDGISYVTSFDNMERIYKDDVLLTKYLYNEIKKIDDSLIVNINGAYGVIDLSGQSLVDCVYDGIEKVEDVYLVRKGDKYGILDSSGKLVIDTKYEEIKKAGLLFIVKKSISYYPYNDYKCQKSTSSIYGIINSHDEVIIDIIYSHIWYNGNGFYLHFQGKSIFMTLDSEIKYQMKKPIGKNLYKQKILAWGIFNEEGEKLASCKYTDIKYDKAEDVFRVSTSCGLPIGKKTWGIIDGNGNELYPPIYQSISTIKDGVATFVLFTDNGIIEEKKQIR